MDTEKTPLLQGHHSELTYGAQKRSLILVYATGFIMIAQTSLYWSSLWPYLMTIDRDASETFFGFSIMAFNLATAISFPCYELWARKTCNYAIPVIIGALINILGNVMFVMTQSLTSGNKWILLAARFVTGLGVGNTGALFMYVAVISKNYAVIERQRIMYLRGVINSLALLVGCGLQVLLTPLSYPGISYSVFHFNMYTAPSMVNIVAVAVVILAFICRYKWFTQIKPVNDSQNWAVRDEIQFEPYNKRAAMVCVISRMVCLFCFSYDLTISPLLTKTMFDWSMNQVVLYNGLIQLISGLASFVGNLIVVKACLGFISERLSIALGLLFLFTFYLISFSWPSLPPLISQIDPAPDLEVEQTTWATAKRIFCDYAWCSTTTRIYLWQYILAYCFLVLAFSMAYIPNGQLFGKILGPTKNRMPMQTLFISGGQIAMTVSPIICSTLFQYYGPRLTWEIGAGVALLSLILVVVTYRKLVPFCHAEPMFIHSKKSFYAKPSLIEDYDY